MSVTGQVLNLRDEYGMFIDGDWRAATSGRTHPTLNPASGETISRFALGDATDIDAAVRAAHAAFPIWRRTVPAERGRTLMRIAGLLRERVDELARVETLDNGKPLTQARLDVESAARYFEFYAGLADKLGGETIPLGDEYVSYTRREPFGVVGVIIPWNAPLQQAARGISPALVAGNTVVAKPAEETPLTGLLLTEIAAEAGLPAGVLNAVAGLGHVAGDALVKHPLVRRVSFTGSVQTGRAVAAAAGQRLVPASLELGGKSADIIFEDADLDLAVPGALNAIVLNSGQICSAGSRLLVQRPIHDEVVARLRSAAASVDVGPGLEDRGMGPLTTATQRDKVFEYLRIAADEGATFAVGGADSRPNDPGWYVDLTILTDVTPSMRVAQEEIFGPVLSVIAFEDEADAVAIANGTAYGLVAGVWTQSLSRAHRLAAELECGQVFVNQYFAGGVETPFGGTKDSGYGREKGIEAALHYTQTKTITIKL